MTFLTKPAHSKLQSKFTTIDDEAAQKLLHTPFLNNVPAIRRCLITRPRCNLSMENLLLRAAVKGRILRPGFSASPMPSICWPLGCGAGCRNQLRSGSSNARLRKRQLFLAPGGDRRVSISVMQQSEENCQFTSSPNLTSGRKSLA